MNIRGFHAHVYYDPDERPLAEKVCREAGRLFSLQVGRLHDQPVGPHPRGSCQLAFAPDVFGAVIPWLSLHREGLTVFIHPETGDDLADHTDHAVWMGRMESLNLGIFGG